MIIRARAPLRISFGGGGTDVPPYPEKYGGVVLSTTIDKYAYCTVTQGEVNGYVFRSDDLGLSEFYPDLRSLKYNGIMDLPKSVIRAVGNGSPKNLEFSLFSDAAPGSGLGSSSALMVAIIRAVSDLLGRQPSNGSIAEMAYKLERDELGIKGGYQDQYSSAFGGLNFMEFSGTGVAVNPLNVRTEILNELLASLVLIDTGKSRLSSDILSRQIESYARGESETLENLRGIKRVALEMKSSLLNGDLMRFGELLGEEWQYKKHLDAMISNPQIDSIYEVALQNGAVGGKVLGAGDGGHMLFFVEFQKRRILTKFFESKGYRTVSFNFDRNGVGSWKLREDGVLA